MGGKGLTRLSHAKSSTLLGWVRSTNTNNKAGTKETFKPNPTRACKEPNDLERKALSTVDVSSLTKAIANSYTRTLIVI